MLRDLTIDVYILVRTFLPLFKSFYTEKLGDAAQEGRNM
jgi:hypothetical protein